MRSVLCCILTLAATACFGQTDTSVLRRPAQPAVTAPPRSEVPITSPPPTPESAPQLSPNPAATVPASTQRNRRPRRRLRTVPPSDPNAFGVGVTIERDTTRRK